MSDRITHPDPIVYLLQLNDKDPRCPCCGEYLSHGYTHVTDCTNGCDWSAEEEHPDA